MRRVGRVLVGEFHKKYEPLKNQICASLTALLYSLLKGVSLYKEDGQRRLITDPTIYTPSSDGRLIGFLPHKMGVLPHSVGMPPPSDFSDTYSGYGSTALMECFCGAIYNEDIDVNVEDIALGTERTANAHIVHPRFVSLATPVLPVPLTFPQSSSTPTTTNMAKLV